MSSALGRRLLIITHSYWPKNNPRANRWMAVAEHWVAGGYTVDVVASRAAGLPANEVVKGVSVYRTKDPLEALKARFAPDIVYPKESGQDKGDEAVPVRRFGRLKKLYQNTLRLIYWPDGAFLWILPAFFKARALLMRNRYDGIVTVAYPFSSHIVGWLLGRCRRGIPWICDYGDPFSIIENTPPNNYNLYGRLNRYVEKKLMSASQRLAVTTDETAWEYVHRLGIPEGWFVTIPPLNDGALNRCVHASRRKGRDGGPVRLLFIGTLYKSIRNPRFLLSLVEKIQHDASSPRVIIDFVGSIEDCAEEFSAYSNAQGRWLFLRGRVSRETVAKYLEQADVLINISNSTTFQLPSKIVEYVATGKPILNVASVPEGQDAVARYLRDYPAVLTVCEENGLGVSVINECVTFISKSQGVSPECVLRLLASHSVDAVARQYVQMCAGGATV